MKNLVGFRPMIVVSKTEQPQPHRRIRAKVKGGLQKIVRKISRANDEDSDVILDSVFGDEWNDDEE